MVEDTVKELTVRSLFEAGVDLDARAQRVFDLDGAYGIQKLQHLIEPRVNYNYLDGDDSRDLPQYDGIDTISPGHTVTYSLTNRLKARAVGEDDQPGRVWEVIRFTLSQTSRSKVGRRRLPPAGPPPRSGLSGTSGADLILEPLWGIRFRGTATFDPYETRVTTATTDLSYEAARWRASFGTRHGDDGKLAYIQGAVEARSAAAGPFGSQVTTISTLAPSSRTVSRSISASSAGVLPQRSSIGSTRTSSGSASTCSSWGSTASGEDSPDSNEDPPVRPDAAVRADRAGDPVGDPARPAQRPVHPGRRRRGVRGRVRGLPGREPRDRSRLGVGRDQAGSARARRRPRTPRW